MQKWTFCYLRHSTLYAGKNLLGFGFGLTLPTLGDTPPPEGGVLPSRAPRREKFDLREGTERQIKRGDQGNWKLTAWQLRTWQLLGLTEGWGGGCPLRMEQKADATQHKHSAKRMNALCARGGRQTISHAHMRRPFCLVLLYSVPKDGAIIDGVCEMTWALMAKCSGPAESHHKLELSHLSFHSHVAQGERQETIEHMKCDERTWHGAMVVVGASLWTPQCSTAGKPKKEHFHLGFDNFRHTAGLWQFRCRNII